VSKKSAHIAAMIESFRGREFDAHYLGYFDCFNRQLFYEAHDVLEELWLADRHGPDGDFYKGMIQLAGAFVHVQKNRRGPAQALLKLARANLEKYPSLHHSLEMTQVLDLIAVWWQRLDSSAEVQTLLLSAGAPSLLLRSGNEADELA
jgi:predicted metal-dependent hydrolase